MSTYGAVSDNNDVLKNSTVKSSTNNNTTTNTNNNNAVKSVENSSLVNSTDAIDHYPHPHHNNGDNNSLPQLNNASRAVRFVRWYIGLLFYLRYPLLLTWVVIVLTCAVGAGDLTNNLKAEVAPPEDSPAFKATQLYNKYWPTNLNTTAFLLFMDSTTIKSFDLTESPEFYAFDCYLEYWITTGDMDAITVGVNTTELLTNMSKSSIFSAYSTWRVLENQDFWKPAIRDYLGVSNYSMAGAVALNTPPSSDETGKFYDSFQTAVPILLAKANLTGRVEISLIGLPSFMKEIADASGRDIIVMFGIIVPIALIIFCVSLDSLRLGILALCSLISTLLLTFSALNAVAKDTDVTSIAPGVVGALCIAMSSDFTYMLASKFRREVVLESANFLDDQYEGGSAGLVFVDPRHVMVMVLAVSGRVVFVTSISVAFASMGMIFFPLATISSIGIGCMLTAVMSIPVSLILTPTLLVTFYRFFASGAEACEWPNFGQEKEREHHPSSQQQSTADYMAYAAQQTSNISAKSMQTTTPQHEEQEVTNHNNNKGTANTNEPLLSGTEETNNIASSAAEQAAQQQQQKNQNGASSSSSSTKQNNKKFQPAAPSFAGSFAHQQIVTNSDGTQVPIAIPPSLAGSSANLLATTSNADNNHHHHNIGNPDETLSRAVRAANRNNKTGTGLQKDLPLVSLSAEAVSRVQVQLHDKRVFYRNFVAFLCQPRIAILSILILLGLCMYPMTRAMDGTYSNAMDQFIPRDSTLLPAWESMRRNFKFADAFAYHVVMKFNNLTKGSETGGPVPFAIGWDTVARMLQVPDTDPRGLEADFYDPHLVDVEFNASEHKGATDYPETCNVSYKTQGYCLFAAFPCQNDFSKCRLSPYCKYRAIIYAIRTSSLVLNKPVVEIYVQNTFLPTSEKGQRWLVNMRAKLQEIEEIHGGNLSLALVGYGADSHDLIQYSNDHLAEIVAILVSCAWFIVTIFFFSLGASLRLLISFVFTFFTVFGLATIIFSDAALSSWPVPAGLAGLEHAQAWLVPFCAIALNIATVLNYDVTSTMRVQQFRHQGIATRSAIVIAAIESSNEVFVAASMTMVSFVGLLFSQVPVMNQLGFYFIAGAFLHGILFRLFLVAPVMSLLGELNWFPYMQCWQKLEGVPISFEGPSNQGPLDPGNNNNNNNNNNNYSSSGNANAHSSDKLAGFSTSVSRNPSLLQPPGATATIVDNEALIWAARESGLDPRRISSIGNNNNNNSGLRESYNYNYGGTSRSASRVQSQLHHGSRLHHQHQNASHANNKAPLDFIFTRGSTASSISGTVTNNNNSNQQQKQQYSPVSTTTSTNNNNNSTEETKNNNNNNNNKNKKLQRGSLAPGDSSPDS